MTYTRVMSRILYFMYSLVFHFVFMYAKFLVDQTLGLEQFFRCRGAASATSSRRLDGAGHFAWTDVETFGVSGSYK